MKWWDYREDNHLVQVYGTALNTDLSLAYRSYVELFQRSNGGCSEEKCDLIYQAAHWISVIGCARLAGFFLLVKNRTAIYGP